MLHMLLFRNIQTALRKVFCLILHRDVCELHDEREKKGDRIFWVIQIGYQLSSLTT